LFSEAPEECCGAVILQVSNRAGPLSRSGTIRLLRGLPLASMAPMRLAVEHVRRMRGGAQAHLMRCDDDGYYIVKFQNNRSI